MKTINDVVAKRTIKLMQERNFSQYKLEKESGIIHGAMDRILSGKNKTVTLTTIYKIASAFNLSLIEFFNDEIFNLNNVDLD